MTDHDANVDARNMERIKNLNERIAKLLERSIQEKSRLESSKEALKASIEEIMENCPDLGIQLPETYDEDTVRAIVSKVSEERDRLRKQLDEAISMNEARVQEIEEKLRQIDSETL